MDIVKLDSRTLSRAQFQQMVQIEAVCGLEPYTPEMLLDCVANMDTFACMCDGMIAGFITLQHTIRYWGGGLYIVNLNVARDYRRQGIAQRLILAACSSFTATDAGQYVSLDVYKSNTPAINLYTKLGFAVTNEPSRNGDTDIVMAVPLQVLLRMYSTPRLSMRILTEQDISRGIEILMNKEVSKTYMLPDLTADAARKLFYRLCELSRGEEHYIRGIYHNNQLVGFINDTGISGGQIELGWVIHPTYNNQGYGTEAVSAAIKDLFSRDFSEVIAGAFSENRASIRVMEKCGMCLLDKTEKIEYRGKIHNCVFYSIKRVKE